MFENIQAKSKIEDAFGKGQQTNIGTKDSWRPIMSVNADRCNPTLGQPLNQDAFATTGVKDERPLWNVFDDSLDDSPFPSINPGIPPVRVQFFMVIAAPAVLSSAPPSNRVTDLFVINQPESFT